MDFYGTVFQVIGFLPMIPGLESIHGSLLLDLFYSQKLLRKNRKIITLLSRTPKTLNNNARDTQIHTGMHKWKLDRPQQPSFRSVRTL